MTADRDTVNGYKAGSLVDYNFDNTGTITGEYDNGKRQTIGQLAVADFNNPGGLATEGETLFRTSNNSGDANIGAPGSGGLGGIKAGALEMSNVDLSRQFTEMITTQRGFQANSKTISTSDQILQELVNLKR
jgi:flagellar hook protein FlgE